MARGVGGCRGRRPSGGCGGRRRSAPGRAEGTAIKLTLDISWGDPGLPALPPGTAPAGDAAVDLEVGEGRILELRGRRRGPRGCPGSGPTARIAWAPAPRAGCGCGSRRRPARPCGRRSGRDHPVRRRRAVRRPPEDQPGGRRADPDRACRLGRDRGAARTRGRLRRRLRPGRGDRHDPELQHPAARAGRRGRALLGRAAARAGAASRSGPSRRDAS